MLSLARFPNPADPDRAMDPAQHRRLRRMISNRESARRSRMRKQRHLEDLHCHAARLQSQNRELAARLGAVAHHSSLCRAHNEVLRSESSALSRRLSELRRVVFHSQLQRMSLPAVVCAGFSPGNEQTLSSLIA